MATQPKPGFHRLPPRHRRSEAGTFRINKIEQELIDLAVEVAGSTKASVIVNGALENAKRIISTSGDREAKARLAALLKEYKHVTTI